MTEDSSTGASSTPQWVPPSHLRDPIVRVHRVDRALWMRTLRGRIPKAHDRLVAMAFATYGESDGSRNFPGAATLAEELFISESTVKRSLSWLAENGWIVRTQRGDRWAKRADVYQLSIPAPVAAEIGKWFTNDGGQWMERPDGEPKRVSVRCRPRPRRQLRQGLVDQLERGDRCPKEEIGVCKEGDRCPSLDPPPEPDQNILHHADRPDLAHADARAKISHFDPDGDVDDEITEALEVDLGHVIGLDTRSMIRGMLDSGCHPRFVYNTARSHELVPC